jgi:hypothetical protein
VKERSYDDVGQLGLPESTQADERNLNHELLAKGVGHSCWKAEHGQGPSNV